MKRRSKILITALLASILSVPASAQVFNSQSSRESTRGAVLAGGDFEIVSRYGLAPVRYWCDAAKYVVRYQRKNGATRLWIVQPLGNSAAEPGKKAVRFTTSPGADLRASNVSSYSISVRQAGYNMTAGQAQALCKSGHGSDVGNS